MIDPFLIYSMARHAWYRPGSAGYTDDVSQAGVFADRGVDPARERKVGLDEAYAALLYRRAELHAGLARTYAVEAALLGLTEPPPARPIADASAMKIEELELLIRSANCLRNADVQTIGDLVAFTEAELLDLPNLGRRSLKEVTEVLANMGLRLRQKENA